MNSRPILYSFRRCPYAIRARMALRYAGIETELREVILRDKPAAMLAASGKGTVPVLVLADNQVLDESIDIMRWALAVSDPDGWGQAAQPELLARWVEENDGPFKNWLDQYKYADRFEQPAAWYRDQTVPFLERLDTSLQDGGWIFGSKTSFADVALFPFMRQFAMVDMQWFRQTPYLALHRWLDTLLVSPLFTAVMEKHKPWVPGQESTD